MPRPVLSTTPLSAIEARDIHSQTEYVITNGCPIVINSLTSHLKFLYQLTASEAVRAATTESPGPRTPVARR